MSDVCCLSFHELNVEGSRLSILFFESFQIMTLMSQPYIILHYLEMQFLQALQNPSCSLQLECESLHFKYKSPVTTWFIITTATNAKTSRNLIKSRNYGFKRKLSSDLRQPFSHDFLSFSCVELNPHLRYQNVNTWPAVQLKASYCCVCVSSLTQAIAWRV